MSALVQQRFEDDCTLCCVAMATGWSWERVLRVALSFNAYRPGQGTHAVWRMLQEMGFPNRTLYGEAAGAEGIRRAVWGRRAILSVPSLTGWKGHHDIFWDGAHVFDPSTKITYADDLAVIEPDHAIIFQERPA